MSYEKQTWNKYDELKTEEENIENGAVVTDNRMNHMETGIGDNDANLASHLADENNPHKVTAAQVGLDKVDNVKQASKVEFDSHTSDISNPHKVTATQIGLDKVDNIQQAAKADFDSHVNNKANPHSVTASQVGAYSKAESDSKLTDLSNKVIANKGNLASGTDLDNVIDIGTYRIGGLTGGTDIINVPSERSGTTIYAYLTVSGTTTSVVQELIVYDSKTVSQIYSRSRSGSTPTFSPWSKTVMADDSGKVTVTGTLEMGKTATLTQSTGFGRTAIFTRVGNLVTVYSESRHTTAPPNGWNREVATLPVGWRPIGNFCLWQHDLSNSTKFSWLEVHSSGQVDLYASGGIAISDYMLSASCVYITKDPFPES
ncbi:Phage tail assembly [Lactococcus lactis subsp. lactis]|jgi:hypothetical protein|uniref:Phage tail assembly n=1 Tax=Lactococcus lactis subsp. lactis TaxID=1360 RepID=A0A0V8CZJ4_LACLL|nr:pyocin knob domain-containing protein [Lactococcus lactis]KSU06750.1 Phage tail assembly [Lactococcus lactis subsp. lactis]